MGKQLLLENINVPGIETLSVYRANGGYKALEKALKMQQSEVVDEVKNLVFEEGVARAFLRE